MLMPLSKYEFDEFDKNSDTCNQVKSCSKHAPNSFMKNHPYP